MLVLGTALLQAGPIQLGDPPRADAWPMPRRAPASADGGGNTNQSATAGFSISPTSRETVRNWFLAVYNAAEQPVMGWEGDYGSCEAGTTTASFRALVLLRINYFRAMAGVPAAITLNDGYNEGAQQAALMMSVNTALDHEPPPTWSCYTQAGHDAAGRANLALGASGPEAIRGYIEDPGLYNGEVGHRRWLLYPQTQWMGTGDVPGTSTNWPANATYVVDTNYGGPQPATRDGFVSWPPPGFVPYSLVYARWSVSFPNADFTKAQVTLSSNGVPVPVVLEQVAVGYGENTLVWYPAGLDPTQSFAWPQPAADTVYTVQVNNVGLGGGVTNFHYAVTIMDPAVPGADTVTPQISGPDRAWVNQPNIYSVSAIPAATSYQWRLSQRVAYNPSDTAAAGMPDFSINSTPGYQVLTNGPLWIGHPLVHLQHPQPAALGTVPADQILLCTHLLLAGANSQLRFGSWVGYGTANQFAEVQVSLDQGVSWTNVFQRAGNGTNAPADGAVLNLHPITVSLANFAGHSFQIRFNYHCNRGAYFTMSDYDGWYFDSVVLSGLQAVTASATTTSATNSFIAVPPATGDYLLEACGLVGGAWPLAWSQGKSITAAIVPFVTKVTWAGPAAIVYGTVLGASQLNATANVPGRFDYDPPLGTMLSAGTGQTLKVTFTPTNTANYATAIRTVSLDVLPAPLTVTANDRSKTYGQAAAFTGAEFTAAGLQNSETVGTVTLTSSGAAPTATVAGSPYSIVPSAASDGTFNPANYSVTYAKGSLTINPVTVTVAGIAAANKIYDGTAGATLNTASAILKGVLPADTAKVVLATGTVAGTFADKNLGNNKPVTISGLTLSGSAAANYTLTQPTTTANLTPAGLAITGLTANGKVYDGTTAATLAGTPGLSGVIAGDVVSVTGAATGVFSDKNAGTGKTVTVSGLFLNGADAGNYTVSATTLTANITPAPLTVTGITAANKAYDGTTTATINTSAARLNGVITADLGNVTLATSGATGAFADPSVGTNKLVTISGLTLSGSAAGNYALTQPTTTADIVPIAPPIVANLTLLGQAFSVSVSTVTGPNYTLEYKNAFTDTVWTAGQTLPGTGGTVTLTDAKATNAMRFYRVRVE